MTYLIMVTIYWCVRIACVTGTIATILTLILMTQGFHPTGGFTKPFRIIIEDPAPPLPTFDGQSYDHPSPQFPSATKGA